MHKASLHSHARLDTQPSSVTGTDIHRDVLQGSASSAKPIVEGWVSYKRVLNKSGLWNLLCLQVVMSFHQTLDPTPYMGEAEALLILLQLPTSSATQDCCVDQR